MASSGARVGGVHNDEKHGVVGVVGVVDRGRPRQQGRARGWRVVQGGPSRDQGVAFYRFCTVLQESSHFYHFIKILLVPALLQFYAKSGQLLPYPDTMPSGVERGVLIGERLERDSFVFWDR